MLNLIIENEHLCFAPANIVNNFFYILGRLIKNQNFNVSPKAQNKLLWALFDAVNDIVDFIGCDESDIFIAQKLRNKNADLEDNLVIAAAMRIDANYLITNDSELLKKQLVPSKSPSQIIQMLHK